MKMLALTYYTAGSLVMAPLKAQTKRHVLFLFSFAYLPADARCGCAVRGRSFREPWRGCRGIDAVGGRGRTW